jgi:hypothetical protein
MNLCYMAWIDFLAAKLCVADLVDPKQASSVIKYGCLLWCVKQLVVDDAWKRMFS